MDICTSEGVRWENDPTEEEIAIRKSLPQSDCLSVLLGVSQSNRLWYRRKWIDICTSEGTRWEIASTEEEIAPTVRLFRCFAGGITI